MLNAKGFQVIALVAMYFSSQVSLSNPVCQNVNDSIVVCCCITTFSFPFQAFAQEELTCQGQELNLNDHQKAQITECLDAAGIKSIWKIPAEKLAVSVFQLQQFLRFIRAKVLIRLIFHNFQCLGVCILEKKGMVSNWFDYKACKIPKESWRLNVNYFILY